MMEKKSLKIYQKEYENFLYFLFVFLLSSAAHQLSILHFHSDDK